MTTVEKIALLENRKNVLVGRDKDNASIIRKIDRNLEKLRNNASLISTSLLVGLSNSPE